MKFHKRIPSIGKFVVTWFDDRMYEVLERNNFVTLWLP
jgi:hypothetical protein